MPSTLSSPERSPCLISKLQRTGWLFCYRTMALVTLSWCWCSSAILKTLRPLRIVLNLLCQCSIHGTTKPGWQCICLQHGLLNVLSPLLRQLLSKKDSVQNTTAHWQCTWAPKSSDGDERENNIVFVPAITVSSSPGIEHWFQLSHFII